MKFVFALLLVLTIDLLLGISQISIDKVGELEGFDANVFYSTDDYILSGAYDENYVVKSSWEDELPETEGSVSTETGNFFTDFFGTIKNWFLDTTGLSYAGKVINAVPDTLLAIGLPVAIAGLIGAFWHVLTVFLLVMVFKGGN